MVCQVLFYGSETLCTWANKPHFSSNNCTCVDVETSQNICISILWLPYNSLKLSMRRRISLLEAWVVHSRDVRWICVGENIYLTDNANISPARSFSYICNWRCYKKIILVARSNKDAASLFIVTWWAKCSFTCKLFGKGQTALKNTRQQTCCSSVTDVTGCADKHRLPHHPHSCSAF